MSGHTFRFRRTVQDQDQVVITGQILQLGNSLAQVVDTGSRQPTSLLLERSTVHGVGFKSRILISSSKTLILCLLGVKSGLARLMDILHY